MSSIKSKIVLTVFQRMFQSDTAKARKGKEFFGKEESVMIGDTAHKMMCYGQDNPVGPVFFDIHGGGYAWGTMMDGDSWCELLAEKLNFHVFAPDYPLSPKHVYPTQLEYIYEFITYILDHAEKYLIDPAQVYIGGRSAGGNMAAALCIYAEKKGKPIFKGQILDHPWLDMAGIIPWDKRPTGDGEWVLSESLMEMLADGYASKEERQTDIVSPLIAGDDTIRKLPPAIIQVAEIDTLEPEGSKYAERLKACGVDVTYRVARGVTHGFTEGDTPEAEEGRQWLLEQLSSQFSLPMNQNSNL